MADKYYVLNERDRELMQRTISEVERLFKNPRVPGFSYDDVDYRTPEVLIVLTPPEGIPFADYDNSTGTGSPTFENNLIYSAECTVYGPEDTTDTEATLVETDRTITVYNISIDTDVPGDTWILAIKEKYGYWIAVSGFGGSEAIDDPGTGTGTAITGAYCDLAAIRRTDCISVSTDQGTIRLEYSGGIWTSDDVYDYVADIGVFKFWYADGSVHLSLNDIELMNCGNGCFTGGPLTGHGVQIEGGTGTGTGTGAYPPVYCDGETFTVCVECSCCLDAGWYCVDLGDGCEAAYLEVTDACDLAASICSGPYASEAEALVDCPVPEEPVSTICCDSVARTLYLEVIGVGLGGDTDCLGAVATMTYQGEGTYPCDAGYSGHKWTGSLSCGINTTTFTLICVTTVGLLYDTWNLCLTENASHEFMQNGYTLGPTPTCDPFVQPFGTGTYEGSDVFGAGAQFLITDVP